MDAFQPHLTERQSSWESTPIVVNPPGRNPTIPRGFRDILASSNPIAEVATTRNKNLCSIQILPSPSCIFRLIFPAFAQKLMLFSRAPRILSVESSAPHGPRVVSCWYGSLAAMLGAVVSVAVTREKRFATLGVSWHLLDGPVCATGRGSSSNWRLTPRCFTDQGELTTHADPHDDILTFGLPLPHRYLLFCLQRTTV